MIVINNKKTIKKAFGKAIKNNYKIVLEEIYEASDDDVVKKNRLYIDLDEKDLQELQLYCNS
mgnify:CR=1 FL=1